MVAIAAFDFSQLPHLEEVIDAYQGKKNGKGNEIGTFDMLLTSVWFSLSPSIATTNRPLCHRRRQGGCCHSCNSRLSGRLD